MIGKLETKRDAMTDALESFWGKSMTTSQLPQSSESNLVSSQLTESVITPQEEYNKMAQTGTTIKDQIEQNVSATQDLTPDTRAGYGILGNTNTQSQPASNIYDLGGFDSMIKKQMSRERGNTGAFGLIGSGWGVQSDSPEVLMRQRAKFLLQAERKKTALSQRWAQLQMANASRQAQSQARVERNVARSYEELGKARRAASGLPVYESPWDYLAGGKRVVPKFEEQDVFNAAGEKTGTRKVQVGNQLERYGGLINAVKETAKATKSTYNAAKGFYKGSKSELKGFGNEISSGISAANKVGQKFVTKANNFKETFTNPKEEQLKPFDFEGADSAVNESMSEINKEPVLSKGLFRPNSVKGEGFEMFEKTETNDLRDL